MAFLFKFYMAKECSMNSMWYLQAGKPNQQKTCIPYVD